MLLGLASVTLEHLTVDNILDMALKNGLTVLEWSENHVQRGNIEEAERIRKLTEEHGMRTASYSTSFDVLADRSESFKSVLETAAALGTDTVVLAAGHKSEGSASEEARAALTDGARQLSRLAAQRGIRLCFAYRRDCFLEDYMRAAQFVEAAGDNVFISWEPN
ncbi:MAG: sugar phosphate isomerase/epimerase family protein, partial [Clostridia bacterium]